MLKEVQGWAVINTHPHKERFAIENLVRQDFEAYCPMLRRTVRHARRTDTVLRPMFPGYVFAAIDIDRQRWRPLLSTFGVRTIVRNGDTPSLMPQSFVDALRAREIEGAITRPTSPYQVDQDIKIVAGPFEGIVAKIIALDDHDRLVVLMNLLNRPVKVKVDGQQVSALR
jgi:transcriptional antiterminator RfaH